MPQLKKAPAATAPEKMIYVYALFSLTGRTFSFSDLAKRLAMNRTGISALLTKVEKAYNCSIVRDKRKADTFCRLANEDLKRLFLLTPDGLKTMALGRDFVKAVLPRHLADSLEEALNFLQAVTPTKATDQHLAPFALEKSVSRINYAQTSPQLATLIQAASENAICHVLYQPSIKVSVKPLMIAPVKLIIYGDTIYVEAWIFSGDRSTLLYENPTLFEAYKFHEAEIIGPQVHQLNCLELDYESDLNIGLMDEKSAFEATIVFSAKVAEYIADRQWGDNQSIEFKPNGSLKLTFQTPNSLELVAWILSFGEEVQVLAPEELRKTIGEKCSKMLRFYSE